MSVDISRSGGSPACVVHIEGDLDLSVVPEVRREVDRAVSTGCRYVVLDLAHVTYADSSALGLLVWLDRRLQPIDGKIVLAGSETNVNRLLELIGLGGIAPSIAMAPNAEHALDGIDL